MKILLTGGTGQIGWELHRTLAPLGRVSAPGREKLDLADPDALRTAVRKLSPDVVVNAAAYTDVDRAESEPDRAAAVNAQAPEVLAQEAARVNAAVVHYSTDYVFGGEKSGAYTEQDEPDPINVYGETKLAGERAVREAGAGHLIVRTSWVYGTRRENFLTTMQRLFSERESVEVVDDQVGSPTWCRLVAEATAAMLARWRPVQARGEGTRDSNDGIAGGRDEGTGGDRATNGTYHVAAKGRATWHEFALAIRNELERAESREGDRGHEGASRGGRNTGSTRPPSPEGLRVERIEPISSEEYEQSYAQAAARPRSTVLSSEKVETAFGLTLPSWKEALSLCLGSGG